MKRLFILWLVLFGLSDVANADISAVYQTGGTDYLELLDNVTLAAGTNRGDLDMIDVGQLHNGDIIAAYTTGPSDWVEILDGSTLVPTGTSMNLNGVISVSGLANGDVVAATNSTLQVLDGTTLTGGASLALNVIDVTGLTNGNIAAAYTTGPSDYVEVFDGTTLAGGASLSLTGISKVTGTAGGDVAVAYGGGTKYLQIFDGSTLAGGAWRQEIVLDMGGLANGDLAIMYDNGAGTEYLQAIDDTLTTWRTAWLGGSGYDMMALDGDYIPEWVPPVCGDANHPYPAGDATRDCKVNLEDFVTMARSWLDCTHPDGCD